MFLTGTEIADAVMHYGAVLARTGSVDRVDIPVLYGTRVRRASFLVGWLTDTASISATTGREELTDPGAVVDLYEKAARGGRMRAVPFTREEIAQAMEAVENLTE